MKKSIIAPAMVIVFIGLLLNSCVNKSEIPVSPSISFNKEVQPIIIASCTESGCHDGAEEFSLLTFQDVIGHGLVPGNANKSKLYKVLIGNGKLMPPNKQLPDKQILTIYLWIEQGAQDN